MLKVIGNILKYEVNTIVDIIHGLIVTMSSALNLLCISVFLNKQLDTMSGIKWTLFLLLASLAGYGQSDTDNELKGAHELGLSFSGFDDFNLLYKRDNIKGYRDRHRIIQGNIGYNSNNRDIDLGAGYAYGRERDKGLAENLDFYHGPEFSLFTSYSNALNTADERSYNLRLVPSVAYILGVRLSLSDKCYLAVEVLPAFRTTFVIRDGDLSNFQSGVSLNSNATSLALIYRFVPD